MPLEPPFTTTTTTTSAATATTPIATTIASRPISPLPQHQQPYYPSPQQQAPFPFRAPTPHLPKPHDPSSNPFLYPFGGGGFFPQGVRPFSPTDHMAGYPPPAPALVYSHGVRAMASPHLDYINQALHLTRPPPHLAYSPVAAPSKGGAAHAKGAPRFPVYDGNGYKDKSTRERGRDNTLPIVKNRRVRITEDASLYALCRSWLRNGINEEIQPQQKDVMQALPIPPPASIAASYASNKKEDEKDEDEQDEDKKSVDHLSPQDLLKIHIKRAKRVRARLREERLQRITRYRSRLRLLLPPPAEQFKDDTDAGLAPNLMLLLDNSKAEDERVVR